MGAHLLTRAIERHLVGPLTEDLDRRVILGGILAEVDRTEADRAGSGLTFRVVEGTAG